MALGFLVLSSATCESLDKCGKPQRSASSSRIPTEVWGLGFEVVQPRLADPQLEVECITSHSFQLCIKEIKALDAGRQEKA